eukprot:Tbor_TRINITY_DN2460_c0_g1::TRINITY_DN2460_c0_g1_i1::g.2622::m.2622/K14767/UTP3, SAS10; U3 small nucleolar RNA-associated protein 3
MGKEAVLQKKRAATAAKKSKGRFAPSEAEKAAVIEDLDLNVDEYFQETSNVSDHEDDDDIVFNRKSKSSMAKASKAYKNARNDQDDEEDEDDDYSESDEDEELTTVLPSDAYRGGAASKDNEDNAVEEAALAISVNARHKKALIEDDFNISLPGGSLKSTQGKDEKSRTKQVTAASSEFSSALETVQRDYSALSSAEKRALLEKESPELIKLLEEYESNLAEVTKISKPLHILIHNTSKNKRAVMAECSSSDRNLLLFLETKVQLLLSYCMHIAFYLLLKCEGKSVAGHPVLDRLVELRVYIEKLWPLEKKLQYSLNKLLSTCSLGGDFGGSSEGANVSSLRPVATDEGNGIYKPQALSMANDSRKEKLQARRAIREAEELEKAEMSEFTRVQRKKSAMPQVDTKYLDLAQEDGYREDGDQFFTDMISGMESDDDQQSEGMTLIEILRSKDKKRKEKEELSTKQITEASSSIKATKKDIKRPAVPVEADEDAEVSDENEFDDEEYEDDTFDEDDDDEGTAAYAKLVQSEREHTSKKEQREQDRKREREEYKEPTEDRRKINTRIETHRGNTKPRPKDRKTPRTAQRYKYEKGLKKANTINKRYKPEPEGGFAGTIKAGVKHSTKL